LATLNPAYEVLSKRLQAIDEKLDEIFTSADECGDDGFEIFEREVNDLAREAEQIDTKLEEMMRQFDQDKRMEEIAQAARKAETAPSSEVASEASSR
jgi:hypothetical protein